MFELYCYSGGERMTPDVVKTNKYGAFSEIFITV